eukprot:ctg_129.g81
MKRAWVTVQQWRGGLAVTRLQDAVVEGDAWIKRQVEALAPFAEVPVTGRARAALTGRRRLCLTLGVSGGQLCGVCSAEAFADAGARFDFDLAADGLFERLAHVETDSCWLQAALDDAPQLHLEVGDQRLGQGQFRAANGIIRFRAGDCPHHSEHDASYVPSVAAIHFGEYPAGSDDASGLRQVGAPIWIRRARLSMQRALRVAAMAQSELPGVVAGAAGRRPPAKNVTELDADRHRPRGVAQSQRTASVRARALRRSGRFPGARSMHAPASIPDQPAVHDEKRDCAPEQYPATVPRGTERYRDDRCGLPSAYPKAEL